MDRGLWASTRHPNYFGDAPVLMTYFLVYGTGGKLTEKQMAGRPGFDEYRSRTSFFLPRPPKRRAK